MGIEQKLGTIIPQHEMGREQMIHGETLEMIMKSLQAQKTRLIIQILKKQRC